MSISSLSPYFTHQTRERAQGYLRKIEVVDASGDRIHAHVQGSDDYCVRVVREGATLRVYCSCPYFEESGPCKHLWAVLQFASSAGAFQTPPAISALLRLADDDDETEVAPQRGPRPGTPKPPDWRDAFAPLRRLSSGLEQALDPGSELLYILDVAATLAGEGAKVELATRARKRDGEWSKPRPMSFSSPAGVHFSDAADREIFPLLNELAVDRSVSYGYSYGRGPVRQATVPSAATPLIARMAATGRLFLRLAGEPELLPCVWREGPAYRFRLRVVPNDDGSYVILRGELADEGTTRDLRERVLVLAGGMVFFRDHAAGVELPPGSFRWISLLLQRGGELRIPASDGELLVEELQGLPHTPPVELPEALRFEELRTPPAPWLTVHSSPRQTYYSDRLMAELRFDYGGQVVDAENARPRIRQAGTRIFLLRDAEAETVLAARLPPLGFRRERYGAQSRWTLPPKKLDEAVRVLAADGWRVEADGQLFRAPVKIEVDVVSGIDWFDLNAHVDYGDALSASLPELLKAARRGGFVALSDGSFGLLPEEWLARHRLIGDLGAVKGDAVRFQRAQLGLLDALLSAMPEAKGDAALAKARAALARFDGVRVKDAPRGFNGSLRGYQCEGLGWLEFLREFGFGGCLADDMGLGKTVQVLALLAGRRREKKPSLVVVPKSLMFNWRREAERFTPNLRVLEHHGSARELAKIGSYDLVITTYGTLVRDVAELRTIDLDYAILDEAQAIKNPRTEAAKAARLLRADHRLVLTGTPVENRLGDLWSLFEFLNPGMLGASQAFRDLGPGDDASRALLARALRPFILRRTKTQVAPDLPTRTEQVIYCELEGAERKKYDELRSFYRATLLGMVREQGIERAQMQILEALLRLRQAACHPGLLDREQAGEKSAKLNALLEQLDEVVQGGHKALVFSQFTTLLGIVKRHLDAAGIRYEYLDGRTRERQAKVDRFQSDAECPVFLVSLKAGGVGLNLTAAEYVFLLDPWWNPAVEAQAIDRTHRIGQSRAVFAYRLIGRDTIEEKVLALQSQKRRLADAIITADNSLLSAIDPKELEMLLS